MVGRMAVEMVIVVAVVVVAGGSRYTVWLLCLQVGLCCGLACVIILPYILRQVRATHG